MGYIDTLGEFAIEPQFASGPDDYVWSFGDGVGMIEVKGKFGYIDHSGRFVIKPQFLDGISAMEWASRHRGAVRLFPGRSVWSF